MDPTLRHLLTWRDHSDDYWQQCIDSARRHFGAKSERMHLRRTLALIFFNPSLRTRTSMEVAAAHLGAHATTLIPGSGTWQFEWRHGQVMDGDKAEHISEAIGVLSRYYDALGVRLFASGTDYARDRDETLFRTILSAATVPVINLESAFYHPCQALADASMLQEHFGGQAGGKRFVLAWCYHPKALPLAVPHSALLMAARLGMDVTVARPDGYGLDAGVMDEARSYAVSHGMHVRESTDLESAARGADVIYAKAWGGTLRYTDPAAEAARRAGYRHWRISRQLMHSTRSGIFMHCLPARRGVVVDDAVLDGPQARHLLQAEFRLHAQKAILHAVWK